MSFFTDDTQDRDRLGPHIRFVASKGIADRIGQFRYRPVVGVNDTALTPGREFSLALCHFEDLSTNPLGNNKSFLG